MDTARTLPFSAETLKGQKILVVDDAADNRLIIRHYLRALGPETSEASNGQEALDKLSVEHFDLVFMDLQMPLMDGYEAIAKLLASENDIPVVAITASYYSETKERCLKAGFRKCLRKPIERQTLLESACENIPLPRKGRVEVGELLL